ncbi:MAG: glycosyltransferase family 2 protein [Actinomyces sp.]|nr:MAG: glycosyltransferase family 2 protein [Actinomyces sp.]
MIVADDPPVPPGSETATRPAGSTAPRAARPSVVLVIVAHEPGEWFTETLESIAAQTYPRTSVVVVDAAGDPGLPGRVAAVLPGASVIDASDTVGFSAAADAVLETDLAPAFFCVCHDDVALDPDAVEVLVAEALRSNAAVVGPKIVDWDDPERLQHVGLVVDRFATAGEVVEPGERDQEQHDRVTDVFAVPSVCVLVRGDLFREIGGFDPAITFRGEDVDLCWRVQLAGGRVIVAPDARVRHRERLNERRGVDDVRRLRARHQLRTVLVDAGGFTRLVTVPLMAVLTLAEALVAAVTGHPGQVADVVSAWPWNLRRAGDIARRRRLVRSTRTQRPVDVQAGQITGSVRLNAYLRGQIGRGSTMADAGRGLLDGLGSRSGRLVVGAWVAAVLVVLVGTRALWTGGVPVVGDYAAAPGVRSLLEAWWSGWSARDLGAPGPVGGEVLVTGLVGSVTAGSTGLARTLLVIAPWLVGLAGVWRVLAVTGSRRGQVAALAAAVVVPLPAAALSGASLAGSVAFAVSPWVLVATLAAEGTAPFAVHGRALWSLPRVGWGLGVAVGLAALLEPASLVVVPLVVAGVIAGAALSATARGVGRIAVALLVAVPVVAVLVAPRLVDAVGGGAVSDVVTGGHAGDPGRLTLDQLARFAVGNTDPGPLVWALALPALLALIVGRSWRFAVAVRLWSVVLVSLAVALADQGGDLGVGLADPAVLLAPGAVAVAVAVGLAVVAVEHDLPLSRFGWRQALVPLAVVAALVSALPVLAALRDGRFGLPPGDFTSSLRIEGIEGRRVLWLGAPTSLPVEGRAWRAGVAWAVTSGPLPTLTERHPTADERARDLIGGVLDDAVAGRLDDLGHRLGGLGVGAVVVVDRAAPAPFVSDSRSRPVPDALVDALDRQLDLERLVAVNRALRVYRNTVGWPPRAAVASGAFDSVDDLESLAAITDLPAVPVLEGEGTTLEGPVPDEASVWVADAPSAAWAMEVDGEPAVRRRVDELGLLFRPVDGGEAVLRYRTPVAHRLAVVVQLVALLALAVRGLRRLVAGAR